MDAKRLRDLSDTLFGKKSPLNSLHQEIADNFYPERADFTVSRSLGTDFAAQLMSSFPVVCRRNLGNQFGTMLRPTARPWFHVNRKFYKDEQDTEAKGYLEWFEETQRRAMYDRSAFFTRATKEGDHDFAAFGQCAISVELNRSATGLEINFATAALICNAVYSGASTCCQVIDSCARTNHKWNFRNSKIPTSHDWQFNCGVGDRLSS
jgi:hypothetical protein